VAEGRFWTDDVETTAQILWASAHGITSLLIQRPAFPWVSKKKLLEQVIHTAIDGLLAVPRPVTVAGGVHDANVFSE
jgi:hypothetical protein